METVRVGRTVGQASVTLGAGITGASITAATAPPPVAIHTIRLPHIPSTTQLHALAVEPGPVTVELPHIASTTVLHPPAIEPGEVTIALPAIASSTVLHAPEVTPGAVTIELPSIASTTVLHPPVVEMLAPDVPWYETPQWAGALLVVDGPGQRVAVWDGTPFEAGSPVPKHEVTPGEALDIIAPAGRSRRPGPGQDYVQDVGENELRFDYAFGAWRVAVESHARFNRFPPNMAGTFTVHLLQWPYPISFYGPGTVRLEGDTVDGGIWELHGTGTDELAWGMFPHSAAGDIAVTVTGEVEFANADTHGVGGDPDYPTIYIHNTVFPNTAHQAPETITVPQAIMDLLVNAYGNKQGTILVQGRFFGEISGDGPIPGRSAVGWNSLGHIGVDVNGHAICNGGTGQPMTATPGEASDTFRIVLSYRERDDASNPPYQDGREGIRRLAISGGTAVEHSGKYNGGIGDHSTFQLAQTPNTWAKNSGAGWYDYFAIWPDLMTLEEVEALSAHPE